MIRSQVDSSERVLFFCAPRLLLTPYSLGLPDPTLNLYCGRVPGDHGAWHTQVRLPGESRCLAPWTAPVVLNQSKAAVMAFHWIRDSRWNPQAAADWPFLPANKADFPHNRQNCRAAAAEPVRSMSPGTGEDDFTASSVKHVDTGTLNIFPQVRLQM